MSDHKTDSTTPATQTKSDTARSGRFPFYASVTFSFMALCIAIAGVAFSVWTWQKDNATALRYQTSLQPLQSTVHTAQGQMLLAQKKLTQMQSLLEKLAMKSSRQDQKWVLAEVEYLLRVAQYNLQFQGSVEATVVLLKNADERIKLLSAPRFIALRQLIAEKITRLQSMSQLDIAGVLVQLDAAANQLSKLPLILPDVKRAQQVQKTMIESDEPQKWWRRGLHKTWDSLQKVVVIRHHHQSVQPLISSEQHRFLEDNARTKLMQAQWAVLYQQPAVFKHSLQMVQQWINTYYKVDAAPTKAILESLQTMQQINVKPSRPDLADLLDKLDTLKMSVQDDAQASSTDANNAASNAPTPAVAPSSDAAGASQVASTDPAKPDSSDTTSEEEQS